MLHPPDLVVSRHGRPVITTEAMVEALGRWRRGGRPVAGVARRVRSLNWYHCPGARGSTKGPWLHLRGGQPSLTLGLMKGIALVTTAILGVIGIGIGVEAGVGVGSHLARRRPLSANAGPGVAQVVPVRSASNESIGEAAGERWHGVLRIWLRRRLALVGGTARGHLSCDRRAGLSGRPDAVHCRGRQGDAGRNREVGMHVLLRVQAIAASRPSFIRRCPPPCPLVATPVMVLPTQSRAPFHHLTRVLRCSS